MLVSICLRTESQVCRPIIAQLLLDSLHMLDFVWARVGARSDRLVVLHAEVDAGDGVLARQHSDLMCSSILEPGRG